VGEEVKEREGGGERKGGKGEGDGEWGRYGVGGAGGVIGCKEGEGKRG